MKPLLMIGIILVILAVGVIIFSTLPNSKPIRSPGDGTTPGLTHEYVQTIDECKQLGGSPTTMNGMVGCKGVTYCAGSCRTGVPILGEIQTFEQCIAAEYGTYKTNAPACEGCGVTVTVDEMMNPIWEKCATPDGRTFLPPTN